MSNINIKKEYIILGVVIVALSLYLIFRNPNKVHYKLPELKPIDTKILTKIEIAKPVQTFTLVNNDAQWLIDPQGYPTDSSKISDITDTIGNLTLTALASKSKNYSRYDLDKDKVIKVKAYQKGRVVREFEIGKTTATNNHTFVKLKDDTRVFHAKKSFRRYFDLKSDELRDKVVMKLDKNGISEIEVEKEGKKVLFKKIAKPVEPKIDEGKKEKVKKDEKQIPEKETETIWAMEDGKEGDKSELDSILSQLSSLNCDEYIEGKNKEDFIEPIYTIRLKGQKDYTLFLYEKIKKGNDNGIENYPVVSSESRYPFLLSTYKAERLMKKPEELLLKE